MVFNGIRGAESTNKASQLLDLNADKHPFEEQTEPLLQQVSNCEQQTAFLYWQQAHSLELVLQHV